MRLLLAASLIVASTQNAYSDLVVYDDVDDFVAASGIIEFDSFENLAVAQDIKTIDRPNFILGVVDMANSGFDVPDSGAVDGEKRVSFSSTVQRSRFTFTFSSQITAFGIYLIDAPEEPDSSGNYDLRFFNDAGDSQIAITGPVANESRVFWGAIKTDGTMGQVGFELPGASDGFAFDPVYANTMSVPEPSSVMAVFCWLFWAVRSRCNRNTT